MLFDHFLSFFFPHTGIVTIIGTPSQTRFAGCPLYTPGPTSQCLPREFKVLIAGYLDSHPRFPLWNLLIPLNVFYFKKNLGGKKGLSLVKGPIMWGSVRVFIMVKKNTKKLRGSPRARWKWRIISMGHFYWPGLLADDLTQLLYSLYQYNFVIGGFLSMICYRSLWWPGSDSQGG